jgi:hypothetical protein
VTRGWRKLRNEQRHNFRSTRNVNEIKPSKIRGPWHVACMRKMGSTCNILVGKREGKSSIGRTRRRWEDNIITDLKKWGKD